MKITDMTSYVVDAYRSNWLFLKIETDEGITGWSECTLEYRENAVVEALKESKRMIIGKDPFRTEEIYMHLERDTYWRYGPVLSSCISGIDMALWDIKGKKLGLPVHALHGGKVRDSLPIYANAWYIGSKTPEDFAAKAAATVANGVRALKWDPFGSNFLELSAAQLNESMRCVEAVRKAVGPDVDLMIEAHGRFNVATSIKVARALKDYNVYWLEEPLHPGRPERLREVREKSPVPIASGERTYSRHECAGLIYGGCVDYIQPDISHVGGITELKKIAALADANYITCSPHNPMGPGTNAASMHVAATMVNFTFLETMFTDIPWRKELVKESCVLKDGALTIPDTPGLGIEINEEAFAKFPPCREHNLHHYNGKLTGIRPSSAGTWFDIEK